MTTLRRQPSGAWTARKRIPKDVQDEYARRYGPRFEAKLTVAAGTTLANAKRQHASWLADVETNIANIRAAYDGSCASLTKQQAAALAGEWYEWFTQRHATVPLTELHDLRDDFKTFTTRVAANSEHARVLAEEPDIGRSLAVREAVRPVLADSGETAQFLAMKGLHLEPASRVLFLDELYHGLPTALGFLIQQATGAKRGDHHANPSPKAQTSNAGLTPWQLFGRWVREKKPSSSTVENWRNFFRALEKHYPNRSAGSLTEDEAQRWIDGLITPDRSARTVRGTWLKAMQAVFGWGVTVKAVPHNPFSAVHVTVPRKQTHRETKAFRPDEIRTILQACLKVGDTTKPDEAVKRWVPMLCAYTGARPGEITQLRGTDVVTQDDIPALHLTPEAGTIKGGHARVVPLHEHVIEQGFIEFAKSAGPGPLFYRTANASKATDDDPIKVRKPRAAQARQRLADWVRLIGVSDPDVRPSHAWRHTFKQIAERHGISERMHDAITGHAAVTVGRTYGAPTLKDMAAALKLFPRYDVGEVRQ